MVESVMKISSELAAQDGISSYDIDLKSQSVVVSSVQPTSDIKCLIESTGKRAVVVGSSGKTLQSGLSSAVAMLGGTIGSSINQKTIGVIRFTQVDDENCIIDGTIDGLSPGYHGLAVHESGDLSQGCNSLGGHYNPRNMRHGSPLDKERHVCSSRRSEPDDFGRGTSSSSSIDGNTGVKLACGIIARSSGLFQNSKRFCDCDGVSLWDERDKPLAGHGRNES
ncbi:CCS [Lepeophtheirus salmonis]|uniref:CCS n=1 Tax=Lepeophtheirus salmonis TaxID=72036 RepID=A0A7R8CFZ0_LEPSM|nr:CCS [Lepeophtheirus salmonis]CAF2810997.1 CCS [Lepeophtheirus salmonis]